MAEDKNQRLADDRRYIAHQHQLRAVFTVAAAVAWAAACYGLWKAPASTDLYQLINPGTQHKPEGTGLYLMVPGPVFLTLPALVGWISPARDFVPADATISPWRDFLLGVWIASLLAFTFYRVHSAVSLTI